MTFKNGRIQGELVAAMASITLALGGTAFAQVPTDEALVSVVRAETRAFYDRDLEAWQDKWLHEPSVTRQVVMYGRTTSETGWDAISTAVAKTIKANPAIQVDLSEKNLLIRKDENYAWLEFDQVRAVPRDGRKVESRERRLMVKSGNQWKIASIVSVATSTFEDSPENVERRINEMGYSLLQAGKTAEAVEMFRVNVRLYPQSWNAYDSLGEAHAAAGQTDLAIQNYERSLTLNPRNEAGRAALAKLRPK
jgi:tetratricopeptide (TPR) repeat protein